MSTKESECPKEIFIRDELGTIINPTKDENFNKLSYQRHLAHEWLKSIKKCNCELDETSDDCRHIRKALKKLFGKQINIMWNNTIKKGIESVNAVYGFKIPYSLQKELSS